MVMKNRIKEFDRPGSMYDDLPDRAKRMRDSWLHLMRKGMCKLTYAQFEHSMLQRDLIRQKKAFEDRRIIIDERWYCYPAFKKLLEQSSNNTLGEKK